VFRLASMTKPITSVAVLMLVEEGKIRLADPGFEVSAEFKGAKVSVVREGVPDYYVMPAAPRRHHQDLLTHTSGLVSWRMLGTKLARRPDARGHAGRLMFRAWLPCPSTSSPGRDGSISGAAGPTCLRASSRSCRGCRTIAICTPAFSSRWG